MRKVDRHGGFSQIDLESGNCESMPNGTTELGIYLRIAGLST